MARRSQPYFRISDMIKSKRMRTIFSQKYDANYVRNNTPKQIAQDVRYLQDTLRRSQKAFQKRGLGGLTDKYFEQARKMLSTRGMSPQQKANVLDAVTKFTREHRLTVSLFDLQKNLTMESLNSGDFSSVVRQSREMSGKKDLKLSDLTDEQLYGVFEALGQIRKGLGKYEKYVGIGSGDEFDAAVEVVYSMYNDNSDWVYDERKSVGDNILDYLNQAKIKVAGKVF